VGAGQTRRRAVGGRTCLPPLALRGHTGGEHDPPEGHTAPEGADRFAGNTAPPGGAHLEWAAVSSPRNPLIPRRRVDPEQPLPALELEVLERWREREVFARSLSMREGAEPWVFYEGPPTANGRPGSHHVLARVFKDIYPRYKTMRGHRVERKGGWDCHGLPVEIAVERELGISSKAEIEAYGIERFNARCRESVFTYLEEWDRLTERIGFWLDLDGAYRTLDESYIESVWWALAEIHRRGLLYEGHKVVPYCPRCGTALSSHEVALGYRDVVDPSVYVRLPILAPAPTPTEPGGAAAGPPLREGDALLIWTTTPWTLPGNVAVAVAPELEYVRARRGRDGAPGGGRGKAASGRGEGGGAPSEGEADRTVYVLAGALVERVLGEGAEILERFPGRELIGGRYGGPIFNLSDREGGGFPIIAGDFVTTEDGTGLVHIAPAFGEDDFDAALAGGIFDPAQPGTLYNPVRPDGTFDGRVGDYEGRSYGGRFVKDPALAEELIAALERRGLLFGRSDYEHSYPHCWRCGTALIYYAKASWYIRTTAVRERMLAANETVAWHPPHIKEGRFGDWLSNNVDWALSRERYWGTPLPLWRCRAGHVHAIGSFAELEGLSGRELGDHHRPYVDEVEFPCPQCAAPMRRVAEVIDVWFDSGAMPFAQHHAPLEHEGRFRERFPADFICEALDQTRGWFYSLLAVSTLLFDEAPYRNVVCLGLILDGEGQKMSKSRGNTVEPWQVIDTHGADAFRWYFFTSKQPWDGYRFSVEAIGEGVRLFLKQLWSTYFFYALYANANAGSLTGGLTAGEGGGGSPGGGEGSAPGRPRPGPADEDLDRWALSRTAGTAELVAERLDAYDATSAGRAIAELVDDLSNWYVRRSRRRFWDGDAAAFGTLRECLLVVAKLLAPFCPFMADEIYDNLDGALASVHLCDFPTGAALPARDPELEAAMATARETVRLGLAARGQAKIKVRQPLAEAVVVAAGREREAIERLAEIVREELNVRRVRFVAGTDELGSYEVKANYRRLGPLFGNQMPLVADAIAALDPARVAAAVLGQRDASPHLGISVGGREHTLTADDLILTMRAPEGYSVEREGAHAVALDLTIDEDLRREGLARTIVRVVQSARKNAGLAVEDRIELTLAGAGALLEAAGAYREYVAAETLATRLSLAGEDISGAAADHSEQAAIDGHAITIALSLDRAHP
jgi:isoleucyl-tRNA synthetase